MGNTCSIIHHSLPFVNKLNAGYDQFSLVDSMLCCHLNNQNCKTEAVNMYNTMFVIKLLGY